MSEKKWPPWGLPSASKLLHLPVLQPRSCLTTHSRTQATTAAAGGAYHTGKGEHTGISPQSLDSLILDFVIILQTTPRTCSLGRHKQASASPLKGAPGINQKTTPPAFDLGNPGLTYRAWVTPKQLHPRVGKNSSMAAHMGSSSPV